MSFGFAIGNFLAVGELAWKLYQNVYKVARKAPMELRSLETELGQLHQSIRMLTQEAEDGESILRRAGHERIQMVHNLIAQTDETLKCLQCALQKHVALTGGRPKRPKWRGIGDRLGFALDFPSNQQSAAEACSPLSSHAAASH